MIDPLLNKFHLQLIDWQGEPCLSFSRVHRDLAFFRPRKCRKKKAQHVDDSRITQKNGASEVRGYHLESEASEKNDSVYK